MLTSSTKKNKKNKKTIVITIKIITIRYTSTLIYHLVLSLIRFLPLFSAVAKFSSLVITVNQRKSHGKFNKTYRLLRLLLLLPTFHM